MSGHVQDLLSAYLDGELSPPERAMVEAHLAACAACAARLEDFATLDATMRELPLEAPAGYFDAFPGRVRERVRGRAAPASGWHVPLWGWAAAAALVLAVLTPLTLERARLSPPAAAVPRAPGGESAPARQAPAAAEARRSGSDASRPGGLREAAAPAPPAAPPSAPEPAPAAGVQGELRKTGAAQFAPPPAESRRENAAPDAAAVQDEERLAGLGYSSTRESGLAASAPEASPEDAPAGAGAAPPVKSEPAFARAVPAPRVAAERDAESDHKEQAAAEAEGGSAPRDAVAGARGRAAATPGPARAQDGAAEEEFAALRARVTGAATLDQARALRDDWRSFAARNPSGARGDEARFHVIEAGHRAWRLSRAARDRAVLARDARTYLERSAGAHAERVRAILNEIERE